MFCSRMRATASFSGASGAMVITGRDMKSSAMAAVSTT